MYTWYAMKTNTMKINTSPSRLIGFLSLLTHLIDRRKPFEEATCLCKRNTIARVVTREIFLGGSKLSLRTRQLRAQLIDLTVFLCNLPILLVTFAGSVGYLLLKFGLLVLQSVNVTLQPLDEFATSFLLLPVFNEPLIAKYTGYRDANQRSGSDKPN